MGRTSPFILWPVISPCAEALQGGQVEEFLIACNEFWDDEILGDWIQEVRNEQVPDFDDA